MKKHKKAPWDLTAPLTRKTFNQERKSATRQEFRPLERQLDSEYQASTNRQNNEIPAWYAGYQADLSKLRGETQGAYDKANAQVQDFSQKGAAQDASNYAAARDTLAKDAALRGTTVDPSLDVGQNAAQSARNNVQTSTLGALGSQGANHFGYLSRQIGNAGLQGIEQRNQESNRRGKISADQRELALKKGDFQTQYLADARESERKYGLSKETLSGQNWRAKLSSKTTRRGQNISSATSRRGQDISAGTQRRGQNITKGHNAATEQQAAQSEQGRNRRAKKKPKK